MAVRHLVRERRICALKGCNRQFSAAPSDRRRYCCGPHADLGRATSLTARAQAIRAKNAAERTEAAERAAQKKAEVEALLPPPQRRSDTPGVIRVRIPYEGDGGCHWSIALEDGKTVGGSYERVRPFIKKHYHQQEPTL